MTPFETLAYISSVIALGKGLQSESWVLRGKRKPMKGNGAGSGWLSINAIPWAEVFLDGIFLGETPLERIKMPVGKHTLVLVNNCVGDSKTVVVEIKKGKLMRKVVRMMESDGGTR